MRHGMLLNAMIRYGRKGEVTGLSLRYDVDYVVVVVVVVVLVIFDVDRRSVSCDACNCLVLRAFLYFSFRPKRHPAVFQSKTTVGNELLLRFCSVAGAS